MGEIGYLVETAKSAVIGPVRDLNNLLHPAGVLLLLFILAYGVLLFTAFLASLLPSPIISVAIGFVLGGSALLWLISCASAELLITAEKYAFGKMPKRSFSEVLKLGTKLFAANLFPVFVILLAILVAGALSFKSIESALSEYKLTKSEEAKDKLGTTIRSAFSLPLLLASFVFAPFPAFSYLMIRKDRGAVDIWASYLKMLFRKRFWIWTFVLYVVVNVVSYLLALPLLVLVAMVVAVIAILGVLELFIGQSGSVVWAVVSGLLLALTFVFAISYIVSVSYSISLNIVKQRIAA